MFSEEDLDPDMLTDLITESREHLSECEPIFLKMEREGSATSEEVDQIFRNIHSIKGGFRLFGYASIIDITHSIEAIFSRVREGELSVDYTMVDRLIQVMDKVNVLINDPTHSGEISIEREVGLMLPYLDEGSISELQHDISKIKAIPIDVEDSDSPLGFGSASDDISIVSGGGDSLPATLCGQLVPGKLELLKSEFSGESHALEPFMRLGKNLFLINGSTEKTSTEDFQRSLLEENNVYEGYTPFLKDLPTLVDVLSPAIGFGGHVLFMNSVLERDMMEFAITADDKDILEVVFVDELTSLSDNENEDAALPSSERDVAPASMDEDVLVVPEISNTSPAQAPGQLLPGKLELLKSEFSSNIHELKSFIRTGKSLFLINGTSAKTSAEGFRESLLAINNVYEGYAPHLDDLPVLADILKPVADLGGYVLFLNSVLERDMMEFAIEADDKDILEVVFVEELTETPGNAHADHAENSDQHDETSTPHKSSQDSTKLENAGVDTSSHAEKDHALVAEVKPLPPQVSPPPKVASPSSRVSKSEIKSSAEESIRVKLELLNSLMNAAGELILNRNQLLQAFTKNKGQYFDSEELESNIDRFGDNLVKNMETQLRQGSLGYHNIDEFLNSEYRLMTRLTDDNLNKPLNSNSDLNTLVQSLDRNTSTLQENIMSTRMQPILNLFNKFPRIIRDLCLSLDKEVELDIKGRNVELDKTILEKLADPMVHLIRNSMDHGIETPEIRLEAGKDRKGLVKLNAFHEGGKVIITISDDGGGIRRDKVLGNAVSKGIVSDVEAISMSDKEVWNLIFAPGFSTADQVSDISGRGVGMDVVKTNIEGLGGTIEVESTEGKGSTFTMRLPLTLAIIPSLIIGVHGLTFAVPQLALEEIVRIRSFEIGKRIQRIHNAEVLRLREKILPLVRLSDLLESVPMFRDPITGEWKEDHRTRWSDRRDDPALTQSEVNGPDIKQSSENRSGDDRRNNINNALQIIVLKVGNSTFGMIVDKVFDNEEIVIKPLSRYLNKHKSYSGMAILGSGDIAMILDVNGLSNIANLKFAESDTNVDDLEALEDNRLKELQKFLIFRNHQDEQFALTLDLVNRIKHIKMSDIQEVGGKEFLNSGDTSIEVLRLDNVLPIKKPELDPDEEALVIVPTLVTHPIGILCTHVEDIVQIMVNLEHKDFEAKGIIGTFLMKNQLVMVLDIYEMFEQYKPEKYVIEEKTNPFEGKKVLLAEDTQFFQRVITKFLLDQGFEVDVADDGEKAWDKLMSGKKYDILVSDVQMPHLDGFGLVERVRKNSKVSHLPIMMLTSMSNESYRERGAQLGVDAYEIKLDKAKQVKTLTKLLKR